MEYHDGTTDPNLGPMAEEKKKWLEKVCMRNAGLLCVW